MSHAAAARRHRQMNSALSVIRNVLMRGQAYCFFLIDSAADGARWSVSTDLPDGSLQHLLQNCISDLTGKLEAVLDEVSEPSPDTIRKLRAQIFQVAQLPTPEVAERAAQAAALAFQAACAGDLIKQGAMHLYAAACDLVMYRRALAAYVEANRSKGGTA